MNATDIIRTLGGTKVVGQALGSGRSAVSNWPKNGIPSRFWPALARLAVQQAPGAGITIDVLEQHTFGLQDKERPLANQDEPDSRPIKNTLAA